MLFQKKLTLNCDDCKKDFNFNLKSKRLTSTTTQMYFVCPHCKKLYNTHVVDNEGKHANV
jgi:ssDNA-binding Zn-finger/Zn-ribbon topoisomerase 1